MEREVVEKFLREKKEYDDNDIAEFWKEYAEIGLEFTEEELDSITYKKGEEREYFDFDKMIQLYYPLLEKFAEALGESVKALKGVIEDIEDIEDDQTHSGKGLGSASMIDLDLLKFLGTIESEETKLTWEDMEFKNYSMFKDFYEFADGCSMLLDKWEIYSKGATPSIKEALKKRCLEDGYKIDDKNILIISVKSLAAYWELSDNVAELTKMIEMYNELDYVKRNGWQMNTPELEFDFELKQAGQHWKEKLLKNS